jgi:hypothetical protein
MFRRGKEFECLQFWRGRSVEDLSKIVKKEELPGIMKTWRLGTPFPRSALFLKTALLMRCASNKSTKRLWL